MKYEILQIIDISIFGAIFLIFALKVGKQIRLNGQKVVENAFGRNSPLSDSVSFILRLGWYLMCGGLLLWNLGIETHVVDIDALLRSIAMRLGICVFTIGTLHGINTLSLSLLHRKNT